MAVFTTMTGNDKGRLKDRLSVRRIILSVVLCFGQTAAAALWLKANGPLGWVFVYCFLTESLFLVRFVRRRIYPDLKWWARVDRGASAGLAVLLLFGAAVIIVGLDITPASAYLAWFQLVREGISGGTLAYMFTVKFAYFGSIFAGLLLIGSVSFALLNLAAIDLLICAVLLGKPALAAAGAVFFVLSIGQQAIQRNRSGRQRSRASLAVFHVTVIAALVAVPLSLAHLRNRLIDDLFSIRMQSFVATLFPNFPFLYNVPGYGYSLASSQIGDRPALTSRPVFEVTAPAGSTVYIRTGVYDTFTGTGWEISDSERRMGERDIGRFDATVGSPPAIPTDPITFKVLIDFYSSLPHTLGTVAFRFPGAQRPNVGFAALGSGFILNQPLRRGSEIVDLVAQPGQTPKPVELGFDGRAYGPLSTRRGLFGGTSNGTSNGAPLDALHTGIPRGSTHYLNWGIWSDGQTSFRRDNDGDGFEPRRSGLDRYRRTLAAAENQLSNETAKYGLQSERYFLSPWEREADLQTGPVSDRLVQLAAQLGRGRSKAATLRAIQSYLVDNYTYSLNTSIGGRYHDAVSNFLFESKTGFCVQFASAFVILARLNGIPARYVTGFLANLPSGSDQMTVTGLSAHSWAETWSNELGWITQEATPPMLAAEAGDTNVLQRYNPTDSSYTQRQLEALLGGRLNQRGPQPATASSAISGDLSKIADPFPNAPYVVAAAVIAFALILLLLRFSLLRFAPVESRFNRVVRKIAKRSRARGLPDPALAGWRAWSRELSYRQPERASIPGVAAALIHRRFFAGGWSDGRLHRRDVTFLERLYRRLLKRKRGGAPAPPQEVRVP